MDESKKRLLLIGVVILAVVALAVSIKMSMGASEETHRELKDVPPKGAGKFDER